jgi:hypothetical protein
MNATRIEAFQPTHLGIDSARNQAVVTGFSLKTPRTGPSAFRIA